MTKIRIAITPPVRIAIWLILTLVITSEIGFRFFQQINANLKAGYGFTDEGGPLIALHERALHGKSSFTFTFVEPLNLIFSLSNQNIFRFRLFGLLILLAIPFFFFFRNMTKDKSKNFLLIFLISILFLSVMTIPSVFRYLLVTPTYQWTILVSSVLINIIYFGKSPQKLWSRYLSILAVTFLVLGMGLSRPTSGLVGLFTVLTYLLTLSIKNLRTVIIILALQLCIFLILFVPNLYNLQYRLLESIKISKAFDPKGYNIAAEIQDVVLSVIYLFLFSILVFLSSRYLSKEKKIKTAKTGITVISYSLPVIALALLALIYIYPRIKISTPSLGFLLSMIVLNAILGGFLIGFREFIALWFLSSLPYISQFGSNTPATGNVQILFLSQSLLTIGIFLQAFFVENPKVREESLKLQVTPQPLEVLTFLTLLFSFLTYSNFADSQVGNNFEKTLYPMASSKSPSNGLYYTPEKLASLETFSRNASLQPGEEVIDLSSYHPGIILYAGGIQSQRALPDKYWIYNIKKQIEFVMELHGSQLKAQGTKVLLETNLKSTLAECVNLSNLIAKQEISTELKAQGFDVKVRPVGVYISSSEDLTLFPNNAVLVETCGR
jgi:hypothetical protein